MMNLQGQGIIRLLQFSGALSSDNRNVSGTASGVLEGASYESLQETWPHVLGKPCEGLLHTQGDFEVYLVEGQPTERSKTLRSVTPSFRSILPSS